MGVSKAFWTMAAFPYEPTKSVQNCEHAFDSLLNSGQAMYYEITRLVPFVVLT